MKKTKLTRSLLAACSIVALSAVMYGCTHSGGPSQDEYDAAKAETAAAEEQAAADAAARIEADAKAEEERIARIEADAKAEEERIARIEADAKAEEERIARIEADAKAEEERIARIEADAKAEEERIARIEADAKAEEERIAREQADADRITAEEEEKKAADDLAAKEAAEKAGMLGALYRGLHTVSIDRSDPLDGDIFDDVDYWALDGDPTIVSSRGMLSVVIAPAAAVGTQQPNGHDAAFATGTTSDAGSLGDWTGTDMMAPNPPARFADHLVVYTDVNVGSEISFGALFPDDSGATSPASIAYNQATRIVTAGGLNMHQGLIMATMENDDGEMVDVFQTGSGMRTHGSPALDEEVFEIVGTFAGATGTYQCTEGALIADPCTSSGTNLGTMLSSTATATGSWTFNPDSGEMASVPDGSYNYFGWWLRTHDTGFVDADAFHGSTELQATVSNTLTGMATYNGQAAGKVAINPQLPGRALIGGAFTADATLTANFEADVNVDGSSDDEPGAISGTISNFNVGGEDVHWTVSLGSAAITTAATPVDHDGNPLTPDISPASVTTASGTGTVGWSIDDAGSTTTGNWEATFWAGGLDGVPGSVTGEFTARYNTEVGRMEGAFGANKE